MYHREYVLAAIRVARIRVQLLQAEIDQVGVALARNMVNPDVAVAWLYEAGAGDFMPIEPDEMDRGQVVPTLAAAE